MKNRFDILYESIINSIKNSIITEDWDRFSLESIFEYTRVITNNFTDPWVKGVTGNKVFRNLMTTSHKKGAVTVSGVGEPDSDVNWNLENLYGRMDALSNIVYPYWQTRVKYNDDKFTVDNFNIIQYYMNSNFNTGDVIAPKVAIAAYAIYAAMHSNIEKKKANLKQMNNIDIDSQFPIKSDITVKLAITNKYLHQSSFGEVVHVIGKSDEYPDLKFDVVESTKLKYKLIQDMSGCPKGRSGSLFECKYNGDQSGLIKGDIVTFKGKVKFIKKETKTIYLNFADVVAIDLFVDLQAKEREEKEARKPINRVQRMTDVERSRVRNSIRSTVLFWFEGNPGNTDDDNGFDIEAQPPLSPEDLKKTIMEYIRYANSEFSNDQYGIIAYDFQDALNSSNFYEACKRVYEDLYK